MKLIKAELLNYRQYAGTVCLDFSTTNKNITIIQGDNGGGKSNLMNAIVWCLFNEEMFKSNNNEGRLIINENAISKIKKGESAVASVTVILGDDKPEYEFKRSISISKLDSGFSEPISNFEGYNYSPKGQSKIPNPEWEIEKYFIPRDLKSFFFFDGEKMDQYFEDTSSVKRNVERISQIDVLNNTIQTLGSTVKSITKEMNRINPDDDEISAEVDSLSIKKEELEAKLSKLEQNQQDLTIKKNNIDEFLKNNSSAAVNQLSARRIEREKQDESITKAISTYNNTKKDIVANAIPSVYAYQALKYAESLIEEETNKGALPPNIKDVFLKELLESGTCICGRSLNDDDDSRKKIQALLEKTVPSDIANEATEGKYTIRSILSNVDFRPALIEILQELEQLEKQHEDCKEEIAQISDQLLRYDIEEIQEKENSRKTIETQITNNAVEIGVCSNELRNTVRDLNELQNILDENNKNSIKFIKLNNNREYANRLLNEFKKIKEDIITEVRRRLENKTREYFFSMIWKKGAFSDVRIIDDGKSYRISVLSPEGTECLGDLSAGEKQVLALSFTAALYSVSGYSVPVIIDTPLARISGSTREKIASALPNYLSETQLIMTMTDTEYTEPVRQAMKSAVGKEYRIQYDEDSTTSKVVSM